MSTSMILKPNWRHGLRVEYEYKTDLFTSRNGTENRRALRVDPRTKIRFRTWRKGAAAGELQSVLDAGGATTFSIPDPTRDGAVFDADLDAGIDQVILVSMPDWVVAGAAVVLINGDEMGVRTVESVAGLTVDFVETADEIFPAGTLMFGAFPSIATKSFRGSWITNDVHEADFDCRVIPGTDKLPEPSAWGTTFDSLPVLDLVPNWSSVPSTTVAANREINDFGRGTISVRDFRGFINQDTKWMFTETNLADVTEVIDFFRLQKGMRGTFYAPSRVADLTPDEDLVSGSNTLRIQGRWPYDVYATRPYNQAISVLLNDGTIIRRKITSWDLYDNGLGWGYDWGNNWGGVGANMETLITLDSTWGVDVSLGDIAMISWLRKSRFASDRLTVDWKTNTVANVMLTVRSLRN